MIKKVIKLVLLFLALQHSPCIGQSNSRIIFFRNDDFYRMRGCKVYHNDSEIHKAAKLHFLFAYNDNNVSGQYKWGANTADKNEVFSVNSTNNSAKIIQLSVRFPKVLKKGEILFNEISVDEFKGIYHNNFWLRHRLRKLGYKSVDDLVKGYNIAK